MTSTRLHPAPGAAPAVDRVPVVADWRRETAHAYVSAVLNRFRVPLPPLGFEVDWSDQPSRHKQYLDTVKVPLPTPFATLGGVSLLASARRAARTASSEGAVDRQLLSDLLACYGLISRRTELNWNEDSTRKLASSQAVWARPTASGGGMYPVETYLVTGPDSPIPTGVYHYDTAHHSLDRLSSADRLARLAAATGVTAPSYLVAAVRFWKNSFKYNSFCYHVVAQDAGCLMASWRLVLGAHDCGMEPRLWFDDRGVARVVDIDGHQEAPYAVVPLGGGGPVAEIDHEPVPPIRHRVLERSRRLRTFPLVEQIHAACTTDTARPDWLAEEADLEVPGRSGSEVTLPEPVDPDHDFAECLRRRHSSFGLFSRHSTMPLAAVATLLHAVDTLGIAGTDLLPGPRRGRLTRAWLIAAQVDELESRSYSYDGPGHRLVPGPVVDLAAAQSLYLLTNYNLHEAAALLVLTGRLRSMVNLYSARGYRALSMEIGQAAQATYLAGAGVGVGVGAVLGLDNLAIDKMLGLADSDEQSLLCLFLGRERDPSARCDHALHRPPAGRPVFGGAR